MRSRAELQKQTEAPKRGDVAGSERVQMKALVQGLDGFDAQSAALIPGPMPPVQMHPAAVQKEISEEELAEAGAYDIPPPPAHPGGIVEGGGHWMWNSAVGGWQWFHPMTGYDPMIVGQGAELIEPDSVEVHEAKQVGGPGPGAGGGPKSFGGKGGGDAAKADKNASAAKKGFGGKSREPSGAKKGGQGKGGKKGFG